MRKPTSAAQRLSLLLPWLNDPTNPYTAGPDDLTQWHVRFSGAIGRFLISFDGSPASGHVEVLRRDKRHGTQFDVTPDGRVVQVPPGERRRHHIDKDLRETSASPWRFEMDPDALLTLRVELGLLLDVGFSGNDEFGSTLPMPSLRFGVRNAHRHDVKLSMLTRRERRAYTAPGAYVLQVSGATHDLVQYLVLHLLTAANMAGMLARCDRAPAPHNWQERCNRWFLRTGHGRKREFCSNACRVRHHAEDKAKQHRKNSGARR